MNSPITALDPVTPLTRAKTILSQDGFTCSIIMLAPGDDTLRREADQVKEHLIYVADGEAIVRYDDLNTILNRDEALLIPSGKPHAIAAQGDKWAKLLNIEIPPRQVVVPQILSFDR